jgi:hypothetical protein
MILIKSEKRMMRLEIFINIRLDLGVLDGKEKQDYLDIPAQD